MDIALPARRIADWRIRDSVLVMLQCLLGLLAVVLVELARSTIGRSPRGLVWLGRRGAALAELAGPAATVVAAARARRVVPAYRSVTQGLHPWRSAHSRNSHWFGYGLRAST